jgi:hypothetical protein
MKILSIIAREFYENIIFLFEKSTVLKSVGSAAASAAACHARRSLSFDPRMQH